MLPAYNCPRFIYRQPNITQGAIHNVIQGVPNINTIQGVSNNNVIRGVQQLSLKCQPVMVYPLTPYLMKLSSSDQHVIPNYFPATTQQQILPPTNIFINEEHNNCPLQRMTSIREDEEYYQYDNKTNSR